MKKRVFIITGVYALLVFLAMIYGMLSSKLQLPPYPFIRTVYNELKFIEQPEIPKEYLGTDVEALISIKRYQDAERLRGNLITFLWGKLDLPPTLPSMVDHNFADNRYSDIDSLIKIDKLTIQMEFGIESNVYHFIPKHPNNKVILYHQGHHGDFYNGKAQISKFLDNGYTVLAFSMPLLYPNNQPVIQLPRLGKMKLTSHENMKYLSPAYGHPVKYFVEPVIAVLNYIDKNNSYSSVSMVGISGGGWVTILAAAVDTRIIKSFPVAGSYPIYLRTSPQDDWGDYEQMTPELYNTANYLELYVLGAYGPGRKQVQVINKYDSCCFSGIKWKTYKDIVRNRVYELGDGEFDLFMDDSHKKHIISSVAMDRILSELGMSKP